jgi:hypothetical protein
MEYASLISLLPPFGMANVKGLTNGLANANQRKKTF